MKPLVMLCLGLGVAALGVTACSSLTGAPPKGSEDAIESDQAAAMVAIGKKAPGIIVWSSSRNGNHDLFTMKTDGSDTKSITSGDQVDWFPRFSPDGAKILFTRSKQGWVSERDANDSEKWDTYLVNPDGSDVTKVVENSSWASWVNAEEIVFVRGTKIFKKKLPDGKEVQLMSSEGVDALDGALLQQPGLSADGKFITITLRGSQRETGIWDVQEKRWHKTALGCQVSFTPDSSRIYWVNPTGNGGSEVFMMPITNGAPSKELSDDQLKFMDLPGRRSHEYFPRLSRDGKWMVWGATQRGHDHDIADYEIYLWEVGTPADSAVRLTFHSGNDRWPDIHLDGEG
jgi:Tol biopolymer transport system component